MLLQAPTLQARFAEAVPYAQFVAAGEPLGHRPQWDQRYAVLELDAEQLALVKGFIRPMKVLCLTGTWCGDCALQGAAIQRIAEATDGLIELRFLLKEEEQAELIVACPINAGFRVPVTWFLAEDFEPLSRIGDRPLSRYRSMALKALGPDANVHAAPPANPVREVLSEMLDEFERTQLMLRLSGRMREKYGD